MNRIVSPRTSMSDADKALLQEEVKAILENREVLKDASIEELTQLVHKASQGGIPLPTVLSHAKFEWPTSGAEDEEDFSIVYGSRVGQREEALLNSFHNKLSQLLQSISFFYWAKGLEMPQEGVEIPITLRIVPSKERKAAINIPGLGDVPVVGFYDTQYGVNTKAKIDSFKANKEEEALPIKQYSTSGLEQALSISMSSKD